MVHKMSEAKSASDVIAVLQSNRNIMTPNIVRFYEKSDKVVELTSGRGIDNEPIFGVTVRTREGGVWGDHENESKLFWDKRKAEAYAEGLM
jgi:hypothetical protein